MKSMLLSALCLLFAGVQFPATLAWAEEPGTLRSVEVTLHVVRLKGDAKVESETHWTVTEFRDQIEQWRTGEHLDSWSTLRTRGVETGPMMMQIGQSVAVLTGRTMAGFSRGGSAPIAQNSYQQEQVGTLLECTADITTDGIVLDVTFEESRYPTLEPTGDAPTPPSKQLTTVRSKVKVPSGTILPLGGMVTQQNDAAPESVWLFVTAKAGDETLPGAAL
ncbi:MAG: hypothetical protein KDA58_00380 [Planctomycetaceae bacterium]|nr:hypothetical protein [Planctomycetaceae bacterium]